MSAPDPHADPMPLHPGSLEGITRIRIDCNEVDLSIEADPSLVGAVHLIVTGSGNNAPSLIREGEELILYQRGRFRDSGRPPTLLVPEVDCPPISGSHEKGDLHIDQVAAPLVIKHGQGDVRINEGSGDTAIDIGKGDIVVAGREGSLTLRLGMGDLRAARCRGSLSMAVGKGDLHVDTCEGEMEIKLGAGDVSVSDCSGGILVKNGSGDITVTRPRAALLSASNGSGDIVVRGGTLTGMDIRTNKGDVSCGSQLLFIPTTAASGPATPPDESDPNPVTRMLRSRGIDFQAGDKGLRFASGPFQFEAGDHGLRIAKGKFTFEASDAGVRINTDADDDFSDIGSFQVATTSGDIAIDVPTGSPMRIEALVNGGEVRSDVPLVSVGRPGPRGSTQRFVGVTDPHANQRLNLRVRTDKGDIRIRTVAGLPAQPLTSPSSHDAPTARIPGTPRVPPTPRTPRTPRTPQPPPRPGRPTRPSSPVSSITDAIPMPGPVTAAQSREAKMRAILNMLANGTITVTEADRRLAELDKEP